MNLLPFILIFILSVASFSYTFIHKSRSIQYQSTLYLGKLWAERSSRNLLQVKLYEKVKKQKKEKIAKKQKEEDKEPKEIIHPRTSPVLSESRKLDIAFLFLGEDAKLLQVAENLLKILYQHCDFYEEGMEKKLLQSLIKLGKKKLKNGIFPTFLDLYPKDNELLYYRILKGTNQYIAKKEGIPPLTDFFTISVDERKPIYFAEARIEILEAVYGSKMAEKIWEAEWLKKKEAPKKRATLSKEELSKLLKSTTNNFEELVSFGKYPPQIENHKQVEGIDPSTGIHVRRKL